MADNGAVTDGTGIENAEAKGAEVAGGAAYSLAEDFTAEQIERSRRRKREVRPLRLSSAALGFAAICVLGFTHLGANLIHRAGPPAGGGWAATAALGAVALSLALTLIDLPLDARMESVNRAWGLSNRGWRLFWADAAKGFVLGAVLLAAVSVGLFALIRALPGLWWIPAAGAAAALVFVLSFLVPLVFEPLFNRFEPMAAGPLRDRLMAVAERTEVEVGDILVSDASRRTNAMNAYVSGMGATRRIVVWDTTVEFSEPDQIASVCAHELGHAARRDVVYGTVAGALAMIAATLVLAAALRWHGLLDAAGTPAAADPRSLALIMAVAALLGAVGAPLLSTYSRRVEARADQYALDLTGDPSAFIGTFRNLSVRSVSDLEPHPLVHLWLGSHPTIAQRLAHGRGWAAEHGVPVILPPPAPAPAQPRATLTDRRDPPGGTDGA